MIYLNIHEAKTNLSRYLERVESGETIMLCRRNTPIAQITPLSPKRSTPRPIGLSKGEVAVTPAFFEPLPESLIAAFYGD
ncbi:MAG: prevent-host-death protein [Deltaproteobacteria bacterium RIFOXYA12_FULL_61_11]|nr:MAG: prevent-host-death protein [Deltaproteobacteria bacterium RIFOXYA12_FULL_61_11]